MYAKLDFLAYRALARKGQLGLAAWVRSLFEAPRIYNVFAWSDPGPLAAMWTGRFARRGRRAKEKVLGLFRQWLSTAS